MFNNDFNKQREVAFILGDFESGVETSEKIKVFFSDWKIRDIFWDEENKVFFSLEGEKETFYPFILNSDLVFNFLNKESDKFEEVEAKLNFLNVYRIQNSLKTVFLFSEKIRKKNVFRKRKIKTPVFEKTFGRSQKEIFVNFPQPAKIENGLVEEIISGETIDLFLYKNQNGEIFCPNTEVKKEIVIEAKEIFEKLNIESFAELSFVSSEKRGLYLLDVKVDIDILLKNDGEYLKKIKKLLQ